MKSCFVFAVFILKILLPNIDGVVIRVPDKNNLDLGKTDVGCYHCANRIPLGRNFVYGTPAVKFTNKNSCVNSSNIFAIENKNEYSCGVAINYHSIPVYDFVFPTSKEVIDLKFTAFSNSNCLATKKQNNSDIVCNSSSCRQIILCCNEANYCNTPERFELLGVAAYTDIADSMLNNSYSQYTYSKCQLTPEAINKTRYQECILSVYNSTFIAKKPQPIIDDDIDNRPPCDLGSVEHYTKINFLTVVATVIYMLSKSTH